MAEGTEGKLPCTQRLRRSLLEQGTLRIIEEMVLTQRRTQGRNMINEIMRKRIESKMTVQDETGEIGLESMRTGKSAMRINSRVL